MKSRLPALLAALLLSASAAERPSVLFIAIDDQNDWIGCLGGNPQAITPNIDALAKRGTLFTNAHCQAPLCNPSRSSVLTGLRPSTTGIHGLVPGIRKVERTKDAITLPQTFTRAGWHSFTCGKIYHDGSISPTDRSTEFETWGPAPSPRLPGHRLARLPGNPIRAMDWGPFPQCDDDTADHQIATAAIQALKQSPADKPFFIACGFRLPHVPIFAPQKWFDLHPLDQLKPPAIQEDDRRDTPAFSWYLHWKLPEPRLSALRQTGEWNSLVRAYLAGTTFMDAQVGRLLTALQESGRADDTIVVLWSDHGWHLGEKLITGKNTLWEPSTHVPLVFAGPGIARDARCSHAVELLDIFPTLLDLTGLPARPELEGHSLLPQLKDASAPREWPAITTHNQGNHAIRDDHWRYIRYADGSEELYDEQADPHEWRNLAADPSKAPIKNGLAKWLPRIDVPMAPGSAERTLRYDPATHTAVWEGKVIDPDELEE